MHGPAQFRIATGCGMPFLTMYVLSEGTQNFLNSSQNYSFLKGAKANLYKCFLPQAWDLQREEGVAALLHPEGVYDDPKGGRFRGEIYRRLRAHFQFQNRAKAVRRSRSPFPVQCKRVRCRTGAPRISADCEPLRPGDRATVLGSSRRRTVTGDQACPRRMGHGRSSEPGDSSRPAGAGGLCKILGRGRNATSPSSPTGSPFGRSDGSAAEVWRSRGGG